MNSRNERSSFARPGNYSTRLNCESSWIRSDLFLVKRNIYIEDEEIKSLLDLSLVITLLLSREIKLKRKEEREIFCIYTKSHTRVGCTTDALCPADITSPYRRRRLRPELEGVQTLPLPFPSSPIPPRGTINPTIRRNHAGKSFLIGR